MKFKHTTLVSLLFFAAVAFTHTESHGQADPAWLKSWNEAQDSRPATMTSSGRIAPETEPGIPLQIHGRVFEPDGKVAAGVVVFAYQRDQDGFEFGPRDNTFTTWRLNGWVVTDSEGRFEFKTIRPAPDHLGREGSHIHFTLESGDTGRQWAPKVFFSDDPLVTARQRRKSKQAGKFGAVREVRVSDDGQHVDVMFRLKAKADF